MMRFRKNFFAGCSSKVEYELPLFTLTAVFTDRGLRALLWPKDLNSQAVKRILHPLTLENSSRAHNLGQHLKSYHSDPRVETEVELDIAGTEFQHLIWSSLRRIPCGKTMSYGDFTQSLNLNKKHTRAVASAIAKNPISVIWPCHRVIAQNGNLTGFAGGLDVKKRLLEFEAQNV